MSSWLGGGVIVSILHSGGSHCLHSPRGPVQQTLFPKQSDGGGGEITASCFVFSRTLPLQGATHVMLPFLSVHLVV